MQYMGTLAALVLASEPEACAPHDSQTEVQEQAEEPESAIRQEQAHLSRMHAQWCGALEAEQEQWHQQRRQDAHSL